MHIEGALEHSIYRLKEVSEELFPIQKCHKLSRWAHCYLLPCLFFSRYKDQINRNECSVRIV